MWLVTNTVNAQVWSLHASQWAGRGAVHGQEKVWGRVQGLIIPMPLEGFQEGMND